MDKDEKIMTTAGIGTLNECNNGTCSPVQNPFGFYENEAGASLNIKCLNGKCAAMADLISKFIKKKKRDFFLS